MTPKVSTWSPRFSSDAAFLEWQHKNTTHNKHEDIMGCFGSFVSTCLSSTVLAA